MKIIAIIVFFSASSSYGFFASLGNFASELTQIASKLQDVIQHAETINQWQRNYEKMTKQGQTLSEQLDVQTDLKDWIGNPGDIGLPAIDILTVEDFLNDLNYGVPWDAVVDLADGSDSLDETHNGLFEKVEAKTVTGEAVAVNDAEFKKFAVVDQQYVNYVETSESIDARLLELQENQALALIELEDATTDAEVQKLSAIVNAQNGQIVLLVSEREKQFQQYTALKQLNENQGEKAKAVSIKAQFKDQNDAFQSLQRYFSRIGSAEVE